LRLTTLGCSWVSGSCSLVSWQTRSIFTIGLFFSLCFHLVLSYNIANLLIKFQSLLKKLI
jgi:hypothetical protein